MRSVFVWDGSSATLFGRPNRCTFFQPEFTKFKETSPPSCEAGCARSESPRRHSAGTSGEIWSPGEGTTAAPLSQHPLLTNLQGWIDVSPNGNCSPALTCLEIKRTQNTERERENIRKSEWKNLHANQSPLRVQG